MKNIPPIELASADTIEDFQLQRLREAVDYASKRSPFYKRLFTKHKSDLRLQNIADLSSLPTTCKDDLQNHNWDFLCVPKSEIVEFTSTSGTLGKPVTIGLTEKDLQRLAYNESISFECADGTSDDLYQLMLTLDRQFMAGIAYYEGIRKLGAGLIRVGPGLPALQLETIQRLNPTVLVAVPSFLVKLIEYAKQVGVDLNSTSVKKAICIGEGVRNESLEFNTLGSKIRESWKIHLYSTYASTEMQTAFTECGHGKGGHLHPELIYLELLDDQGNVVRKGETGEITITTLGVEGMPLIRYRTGDIARTYHEVCTCGRNTLRVGPILGRKQQMIKLKGTTLYPPALFELLQLNGVIDYVVEAFTGNLGTDELKLHIHFDPSRKESVEKELLGFFQSRLRVVPELVSVSLKEIEAMQHSGNTRKLKKFIDNRK
ncbi:MAG TPA: AMP-binding protein [Chryseosolibacter sp.]